MQGLKFTTTKRFERYGCRFVGNLLVCDYSRYQESLPNWGSYNGQCTYDAIEYAQEQVVERYSIQKLLLTIPVLVWRLNPHPLTGGRNDEQFI